MLNGNIYDAWISFSHWLASMLFTSFFCSCLTPFASDLYRFIQLLYAFLLNTCSQKFVAQMISSYSFHFTMSMITWLHVTVNKVCVTGSMYCLLKWRLTVSTGTQQQHWIAHLTGYIFQRVCVCVCVQVRAYMNLSLLNISKLNLKKWLRYEAQSPMPVSDTHTLWCLFVYKTRDTGV